MKIKKEKLFFKAFKWSVILGLTYSITFSTVFLDTFGTIELMHLCAVIAIIFGDLEPGS